MKAKHYFPGALRSLAVLICPPPPPYPPNRSYMCCIVISSRFLRPRGMATKNGGVSLLRAPSGLAPPPPEIRSSSPGTSPRFMKSRRRADPPACFTEGWSSTSERTSSQRLSILATCRAPRKNVLYFTSRKNWMSARGSRSGLCSIPTATMTLSSRSVRADSSTSIWSDMRVPSTCRYGTTIFPSPSSSSSKGSMARRLGYALVPSGRSVAFLQPRPPSFLPDLSRSSTVSPSGTSSSAASRTSSSSVSGPTSDTPARLPSRSYILALSLPRNRSSMSPRLPYPSARAESLAGPSGGRESLATTWTVVLCFPLGGQWRMASEARWPESRLSAKMMCWRIDVLERKLSATASMKRDMTCAWPLVRYDPSMILTGLKGLGSFVSGSTSGFW
mmetsp:Transcript_26438/g.59632  ORF Transcript_26438/g.59632 Transcript_26438/m.59632 type:complete len:389 (+) Transcript_26438:57-1223(+)